MGQYWYPVNLTKKEFIHPHQLGTGLKLWEQVAGPRGGVGSALVILLAAQSERRGGGDLTEDDIIGRWAGDKIAIVGDYASDDQLPEEYQASTIYQRCRSAEDLVVMEEDAFTDITLHVCRVIERELGGQFVGDGDGWRDFKETETA